MAKKSSANGKSAAASNDSSDPAQQAAFIFNGTVQRVKASAMPEVKPDDRTAVVRVDEVLQAPPAMAGYAGKEITVQLGGRKKVKGGDRATFFTNGWRFGKGLAVRSLDHHPLSAAGPRPVAAGPEAAAAAAAPLAATNTAVTPVQRFHDSKLKQSLDRADVVVTGRVSSVHAAAGAGPGTAGPGVVAAAAGAGPSAPAQRISEHDPIWQEAVIEVTGVEKGQMANKQVVVRFPSSNDVRWRHHAKFRPGQEGVFLLQTDGGARPATAPATAAAIAGPGTAAAAAPAAAFAEPLGSPQPLTDVGKIRSLLGTTTPPAGAAGNG